MNWKQALVVIGTTLACLVFMVCVGILIMDEAVKPWDKYCSDKDDGNYSALILGSDAFVHNYTIICQSGKYVVPSVMD